MAQLVQTEWTMGEQAVTIVGWKRAVIVSMELVRKNGVSGRVCNGGTEQMRVSNSGEMTENQAKRYRSGF